jgi:hypothetical protein
MSDGQSDKHAGHTNHEPGDKEERSRHQHQRKDEQSYDPNHNAVTIGRRPEELTGPNAVVTE